MKEHNQTLKPTNKHEQKKNCLDLNKQFTIRHGRVTRSIRIRTTLSRVGRTDCAQTAFFLYDPIQTEGRGPVCSDLFVRTQTVLTSLNTSCYLLNTEAAYQEKSNNIIGKCFYFSREYADVLWEQNEIITIA